jgi:hypothetical protein
MPYDALPSPDEAHAILSQSARGRALLSILEQTRRSVQQPTPRSEKFGSNEYLIAATRASYTLMDFPKTTPRGLTPVLDDSLALATPVGRLPHYALSDSARQSTFDAWANRPELARALAEARQRVDPETGEPDVETQWFARFLNFSEADGAEKSEKLLTPLDLSDMKAVASALAKAVPLKPELQLLAIETRRRLDCEEILGPLRVLIGTRSAVGQGGSDDDFVGRELELERLYAHVGAIPPANLLARLSRLKHRIGEAISRSNGALVIHAIGGMGKSSLVAKFVMEHAIESDACIYFAYLDFDRATLSNSDASGLLVEIARQVGLQVRRSDVSDLDAPFRDLRMKLRENRNQTSEPFIGDYVRMFRLAVDRLQAADRPFLLVLDTFERIQKQGSAAITEVTSLLAELGLFDGRWPRLRVVVCGRNDAPELRDQGRPLPIDLGPLSLDGAERLAQKLLETALPDTNQFFPWSAAIGKASNGYPLIVRVLVEVIIHAKVEERTRVVEDIIATSGQAAKVATVLYKRFADRLDVHGGAEILKAAVCLWTVTEPLLAAALAGKPFPPSEIFHALRRDSTLWSEVTEDAMRWRADLRAILLQCVREEDHTLLEEVATRAWRSARASTGAKRSCADLIYYSLLAGHGVEEADAVPRGPTEQALLADASEDFPVGSVERAYLEIMASGRAPLVAELERLPPRTGWRLALDAEPSLTRFGGRNFEPRLQFLLKAERDLGKVGSPYVVSQSFRLHVRAGAWSTAKRFSIGRWICEAAGREALFFLGARTALPAEMNDVFVRALDEAPDAQSSSAEGTIPVHRLVAARATGRKSFEWLDTDKYFQISANRLRVEDDSVVLLAGAFGEVAADWAFDALISGERANRGTFFDCLSSLQLRLLYQECQALLGVEEARRLLAAAKVDDSVFLTQENESLESHVDPQLILAAASVLQILRKVWSAPQRRAFVRRFCGMRDPYWAETFGYALARVYATRAALSDGMQEVFKILAGRHVIGSRLQARCASPSVARDPIIFLRMIDEASALPSYIEAMRAKLLDTNANWLSRSKSALRSAFGGSDDPEQALQEFLRLAEDYRSWDRIKTLAAGGAAAVAV